MSFSDKFITCPDCARLFTFSASDQRLDGELGHDPPRRCQTCRLSLEASGR
ncbi:MAG: zinc-ribbon domain containing protein [Dehalococcoidia bacterium]